MRKLLGAAVVLVVLVAGWWAYALAGAAELASAASRGDVESVARRTDWPALTRSLSGQIAHAFLDQNPQFRKLLGIEQEFVGSAGAGAAEALLRQMLTPQTIAELLDKGRAALPGAGGAEWRMPALGEAFRNGVWQAVKSSRFDGPASFVVGLNGPDGRYGVHLHLSGATWRLSGLDVPEDVSARLARLIAERAGAPERGGG